MLSLGRIDRYLRKLKKPQIFLSSNCIDLRGSKFFITVTCSPEFSFWYVSLPEGEVRRKLQRMIESLKERPFAGDYIRRELWPKGYAAMELSNLYRFEVDKGMRATYSIRREGLNVEVRIIEFFATHKEYEKRFGY